MTVAKSIILPQKFEELDMNEFTKMIHTPIVESSNIPITQPIYQTTIFEMPSFKNSLEEEESTNPKSYYTRMGNPTVEYLATQLCYLTGYEKSLIFPSGMAAICSTFLALCKPGTKVAVSTRLYVDTLAFVLHELPKLGVVVCFFDVLNLKTLKNVLAEGCSIVYFETLSNPDLTLADIEQIKQISSSYETIIIGDATFTPPGIMKPKFYNMFDICIHSLTKYIGGHSAISGGTVLTSSEIFNKIWRIQALYGSCMDPQSAWIVSLGLQTLALRTEKQGENAKIIAEYLSGHPKVKFVNYPTLSNYLQKDLNKSLLCNGGGVISFELMNIQAIETFIDNLTLIKRSISLGGNKTCIGHSNSMRSSKIGDSNIISDEMVRMSVGIENAQDLILSLENAFEYI